jgi:hypothetical protein
MCRLNRLIRGVVPFPRLDVRLRLMLSNSFILDGTRDEDSGPACSNRSGPSSVMVGHLRYKRPTRHASDSLQHVESSAGTPVAPGAHRSRLRRAPESRALFKRWSRDAKPRRRSVHSETRSHEQGRSLTCPRTSSGQLPDMVMSNVSLMKPSTTWSLILALFLAAVTVFLVFQVTTEWWSLLTLALMVLATFLAFWRWARIRQGGPDPHNDHAPEP